MGSGKGKTNRELTTKPQPGTLTAAAYKRIEASFGIPNDEAVNMEPEQWTEFVKGSGIQNVKLNQYYLGKNFDNGTNDEYEQIMAEVFTDMIAAKAITLPSPYTPDYFQFKMEENGKGYAGSWNYRHHSKNPDKIRVVCKGSSL